MAATGPRENAQILAHALYLIDSSTHAAGTALVVHPQWQGAGPRGSVRVTTRS
ncbi:MAG: hypothetical protein Q8M01_20985 [Rubrivivax sp.]|nr:hypothetical protein [Rubrivivax sp.]